jgi:hypothetical protein
MDSGVRTFAQLLDDALARRALRWRRVHTCIDGRHSFYLVGQGAGFVVRVLLRPPLRGQIAAPLSAAGDAVWFAGQSYVTTLRDDQAARAFDAAYAAFTRRKFMINLGLLGQGIPEELVEEFERVLGLSFPAEPGTERDDAAMVALLADLLCKLGHVGEAARLREARPEQIDAILSEIADAHDQQQE